MSKMICIQTLSGHRSSRPEPNYSEMPHAVAEKVALPSKPPANAIALVHFFTASQMKTRRRK